VERGGNVALTADLAVLLDPPLAPLRYNTTADLRTEAALAHSSPRDLAACVAQAFKAEDLVPGSERHRLPRREQCALSHPQLC
jgi:hypothetical protein